MFFRADHQHWDHMLEITEHLDRETMIGMILAEGAEGAELIVKTIRPCESAGGRTNRIILILLDPETTETGDKEIVTEIGERKENETEIVVGTRIE